MERIELVGAALIAVYFGWVIVDALRSGTIRYRLARHSRTEEPKTFWLTVSWYGVLALSALSLVVWRLIANP